MPLLSPGVLIKEKDFSTIVPNVASSIGGLAGDFTKGPIETPILISSEDKLVEVFGQPNDINYGSWFSVSQFLGYTNKCWVVRAAPTGCMNASQTGNITSVTKYGDFTQSTGSTTINVKIVHHLYTVGQELTLDFTGTPAPADGAYTVATLNTTTVATLSGSSSGTIATVNTATAHDLVTGDWVTIAGVSPAGYNGTYQVTRVDNDTITYTTTDSNMAVIGTQGTVLDINRFTVTGTVAGEDRTGTVASTKTSAASILVKNYDDYADKWSNNLLSASGTFIAKQPGTAGNALKIVLIDAGNYDLVAADSAMVDYSGKNYTEFLPAIPGTSSFVGGRATATPTTKSDELSVLIIDNTGQITNTANSVLEVFNYCSKAVDAVDYKNTSMFYGDVVNAQSAYAYWNSHPSTSVEVADNISTFAWGSYAFDVSGTDQKFADFTAKVSYTLSGGLAGAACTPSEINDAYDRLANPEEIDVNLIITGNHPIAVIRHAVEMAQTRRDCVTFASPHKISYTRNSGVVSVTTEFATPFINKSTMVEDLIAFKDGLNLADLYQSYGIIDTGYKYIYDAYNRKYRWIPLNGDIAGVCARTDQLTDPWWSPGGFNRGSIRNVIKLNYVPSQAERDILYPKGINPVVTFPGSGTVLFGDRTMQEKPSAFDRINVRRLFIILEKSISTAAKYQLFEFNDSFTRAQFKNMVEPFLRDVQGRRGITDFMVICDETNNTGEVIDRNEFIADIYVKPARSINFIYLNFIATKTGVNFSTVIGG